MVRLDGGRACRRCDGPVSEAARGSLLAVDGGRRDDHLRGQRRALLALFRDSRKLLPAAVIACFLLLAEAMIGVAVTGERKWHASWWEWHGLIVTAYLIIGFAARREWRDERFRHLYLSTTRERRQDISVLFGDLVGFTTFAERATPGEVGRRAQRLLGRRRAADHAPVRRRGGEVHRRRHHGAFNSRGDQPDHALRAARAALALQQRLAALAEQHPDWPRMRVGVNSGEAVLREIGGDGHVAYPLVGDTINTGSRLESLAPAGGVLIGAETYGQLPDGAVVEAKTGLRIKGKEDAVARVRPPRSAVTQHRAIRA